MFLFYNRLFAQSKRTFLPADTQILVIHLLYPLFQSFVPRIELLQLLIHQSLLLKHSLVQVGLLKLCHTNLRFPRCDIAEALIQFFLFGVKLVHSSLQLVLHFMNLLFSEYELLFVEL